MQEKHIFALYIKNLDLAISNNRIFLSDEQQVHRIGHVLRLKQDNILILFNRTYHVTMQITVITKKNIQGIVITAEKNSSLTPKIKLLLPVLKKDALSEAVYNAVEVGANEIQLVQTCKAQRIISNNEFERLERVAIAAAEQSKNFVFPIINKKIPFDDAVKIGAGAKLFFDPAGKRINEFLDTLQHKKSDAMTLLIGPEGDLTQEEKDVLTNDQWMVCALTPTILRSAQAISVGVGIIRSMINAL